MIRFYYKVGEYNKESEPDLPCEPWENDQALISYIFQTCGFDPIYPEDDRIERNIRYIGYLDSLLHNWEGDEFEWLDHTVGLFMKEYESFLNYPSDVTINQNSIIKIVDILSWLIKKRAEVVRNKEDADRIAVQSMPIQRIKWLGKPAQFAYLFKELADHRWIEKPRNSNLGLAEMCFKCFHPNTDSFQSFYIEFTEDATLTDGGKSFFQLKENKNPKV